MCRVSACELCAVALRRPPSRCRMSEVACVIVCGCASGEIKYPLSDLSSLDTRLEVEPSCVERERRVLESRPPAPHDPGTPRPAAAPPPAAQPAARCAGQRPQAQCAHGVQHTLTQRSLTQVTHTHTLARTSLHPCPHITRQCSLSTVPVESPAKSTEKIVWASAGPSRFGVAQGSRLRPSRGGRRWRAPP